MPKSHRSKGRQQRARSISWMAGLARARRCINAPGGSSTRCVYTASMAGPLIFYMRTRDRVPHPRDEADRVATGEGVRRRRRREKTRNKNDRMWIILLGARRGQSMGGRVGRARASVWMKAHVKNIHTHVCVYACEGGMKKREEECKGEMHLCAIRARGYGEDPVAA